MIVTPAPLATLGAPAGRLLAALQARGERVCEVSAVPAGAEPVTLAVSDGAFIFDLAGTLATLGRRPFRVLVLSRLGAHPDAKAASLQRLWRLEEHVRKGGAPTLTLRFAPLVGADSPLWRLLRGGPALPRKGRQLLNPVAEDDAIETLVRALADARPWRASEDWYEVAGETVYSLAELRDLAVRAGGSRAGGAWEPPIEELAEHRLAEPAPWLQRFAMRATPIADAAVRWAA